jgi:hypothetical protein
MNTYGRVKLELQVSWLSPYFRILKKEYEDDDDYEEI